MRSTSTGPHLVDLENEAQRDGSTWFKFILAEYGEVIVIINSEPGSQEEGDPRQHFLSKKPLLQPPGQLTTPTCPRFLGQ